MGTELLECWWLYKVYVHLAFVVLFVALPEHLLHLPPLTFGVRVFYCEMTESLPFVCSDTE